MLLITITLNHNVLTVGQPNNKSPDAYSQVNTTEKAVEIQVVDKSLPMSQRIVDSRLTSVDPWDAIAPQRDKMRNNDEPHYWLDMNLQDVGLYLMQMKSCHLKPVLKKDLTKWNSWMYSKKPSMMWSLTWSQKLQKNHRVLNIVNDYMRRRQCLLFLKPMTKTVLWGETVSIRTRLWKWTI